MTKNIHWLISIKIDCQILTFPHVSNILDILAQCNRLKSTPTFTSSLWFSRLYIHMLGFIVTQVIV